jgi:hypothetical protein
MGYLATGVIVAVAILIVIAVVYVQHELRQMRAPGTPGRGGGGLRVRGHDRQDGQDLRPVRRAPRLHGLPADVDGGRAQDHPPPWVPAPRTAACGLAARVTPGQAVAVRPRSQVVATRQ